MRSFNIVCSRESVQDIIVLAGLTGLECSSPEVLVRFLAGRRARLGFTAEQLQELKRAFDECEQAGSRSSEGQLIKASEISNGLLGWAGLYCVEPLRKLLSKMEGSLQSERPIGCSFYEFAACAGRVREMMLHEVFDEFQGLDTDLDGYIGAEDLRPLSKSLGFNLVDAELNEFCQQENIAADAWLDFEVCWKFIACVRAANGFTAAERDELGSAFSSFCDESGEMPNLAVMELLDHIGFDNTLEQVMAMVEQVDFNGNGTMDSGEFMRLMRIQRELSLVNYQITYDKYDFGKPDNAEDDKIAAALTECHIPPDQFIMQQAIQPLLEENNAEDDGLSFEAFSQVAETCRRLYPVQKRKRAYFKEEEVALIQMAFAQQDSSRRGFISVGDLVWQLADSGLPVNTKGGRAVIFEKLDKARNSARAAGVDDEDVGNPGSPRVRCMPVVHLVRDILKQHNKEVSEKAERLMKGVKFSADEIAEFRKFFDSKADAPPTTASSPPKRRRSVACAPGSENAHSADLTLAKVLARFKHIPRLPVDDVLNMSQNEALQVSAKQKLQLSQRIMNLADDGRGLDFASFVQVMQWMLDSNYGNVKATDIAASGISPLGDTQDAKNVRQSRLGTRRVSV
jgi:Ca2+-binding EF-hand superfamily protein